MTSRWARIGLEWHGRRSTAEIRISAYCCLFCSMNLMVEGCYIFMCFVCFVCVLDCRLWQECGEMVSETKYISTD